MGGGEHALERSPEPAAAPVVALKDAVGSAAAPAGGGSSADRLLRAPMPDDDRPGRRWAYPWWLMILISFAIAYQASVLLVHNLPGKGLASKLHTHFNEKLDAGNYMRATGQVQSWAMFAPNPHRSNVFMKVLVKDKQGEIWDLAHDIYGKRTYPYLFYDRMGKINRRVVEEKGYRRHYAAHVCREWELDHGGEAAEEVQYVKMWTQIPPPEKLIMKGWWYDPMKLHLHQREEDAVKCATVYHGQVPNYIREREGLPLLPEGKFRDVTIRTWVDTKKTKERQEAAAKAADDDASVPEERSGEGQGQ
jgi:hypothetical protein